MLVAKSAQPTPGHSQWILIAACLLLTPPVFAKETHSFAHHPDAITTRSENHIGHDRADPGGPMTVAERNTATRIDASTSLLGPAGHSTQGGGNKTGYFIFGGLVALITAVAKLVTAFRTPKSEE